MPYLPKLLRDDLDFIALFEHGYPYPRTNALPIQFKFKQISVLGGVVRRRGQSDSHTTEPCEASCNGGYSHRCPISICKQKFLRLPRATKIPDMPSQ
ncbi:hypothetical protein WK17_25690 [Burkholderia multivorans]|nr:hypothetical protein WK17_25690 [Burkholderia multivorans]